MATPTAKFEVIETPDAESLAAITAKVQAFVDAKGIGSGKLLYTSKVAPSGWHKLVILGRCQAPERDQIEAFCMGVAAA